MAQQRHTFAGALIENLPQELVDVIAELLFKNDYTVNQTIKAGYHPPSILQVNQAYRKHLLIDYYRYTTFTMEVQADRPDIGGVFGYALHIPETLESYPVS
nr:hypothetical protein B0A51_04829 [Rachicladosporium sp. CCFEE 5018]